MAAHSPIVLGSIQGRLTPSPGAVLDVVPWGLDVMTRPFVCITSEFERLVPRKGSNDQEFRNMYLRSYTEVRVEGLLSNADLVYVGYKGGGPPEPLVTRSREDRVSSIERTIVSTGGGSRVRQYDVLFQTPIVNIRYIVQGNQQTRFQTSIETPLILVSNWQLVENTTNAVNAPVRGTSFPPSPNWTLNNDGGIRTPIEGTPFFDVSITYYWMLQ